MTTIAAKMITDSISSKECGRIRLRSLQLRYPRFIHSELMTHRVFSRSASSSRAVPVERLIEDIKRDMAMPIYWGKNQKGMQAKEECDNLVKVLEDDLIRVIDKNCVGIAEALFAEKREDAWKMACERAIFYARAFSDAGYHKQIVNRLLEPFSHINVLVTSTYWDNFFNLRDHKDAMPEIRELALQMKEALSSSTPTELHIGEWHLPYITEKDWLVIKPQPITIKNILIKCSIARCARVSYLTHDMKEPDIESDLKLYDRLVGSEPLHASPCEHVATPDEPYSFGTIRTWKHKEEHGNFLGWRQWRKTLKGEFVNEYENW